MSLDSKFLSLLACPVSHAPLVEDGDFLVSTDSKTRRRYRIEDNIPNLLVSDSEVLDEASWQEIIKRHAVN
jgi:uncharacterized protein YbaR (Trm112 family)